VLLAGDRLFAEALERAVSSMLPGIRTKVIGSLSVGAERERERERERETFPPQQTTF
jgi:hypothetical protein